jgi:hypothetical protein
MRRVVSAATGANGCSRSDICAAEARDVDPGCSVLSVMPDRFDAVSWGLGELDAGFAAGRIDEARGRRSKGSGRSEEARSAD